MLTTTYAGLSDLGRQRSRNDDRWGADPKQGLYIVADGVGSTSHGDRAAELVVELLPTYVARHFAGLDRRDGDVAARLGRAVVEMCSDLHARSLTDSELAGAGTTLVTAIITESPAVIAHLGDSRAYLFRDRQVQRLTGDHTIVQAVMDAGELSQEQAARHPNRSVVTRHVLMTPPAKPDVSLLDLQPGDRILLCSDGLHGVVDDATLAAILADHPDAADACRALIARANDAGGPDNITVVVVDADGAALPAPPPTAQPTVAGPVPPMPTAQPTVAGPVPPIPTAQPTVAGPVPPIPTAQPTMAGPLPPIPTAQPTMAGPVPPVAAAPPQQQPFPPAPPAGRVPPRFGPPPPQPQRPARRRGLKWALAGLVVVLLAAAGAGYLLLWPRQTASQNPTGQTAKPSAQAQTPSAQTVQPNPPLGQPTPLPFPDLKHPIAVAVDAEGNVYILAVKGDNTVVLKLAKGGTAPTELFIGPKGAFGIAVDGSGKYIYVIDGLRDGRLRKWTEGMSEPDELPLWTSLRDFPLLRPSGVAVDTKGDVYVVDSKNRVMRVSADSTKDSASATPLSFNGLNDPVAVAVDTKGDVYVIDHGKEHHKGRLLKQVVGGSRKPEVVEFAGLDDPTGVAVDAAGDVFITDRSHNQVFKLPVGSKNPIVLPFGGLNGPTGVAVDTNGNVYVTDDENGKVLELPAG